MLSHLLEPLVRETRKDPVDRPPYVNHIFYALSCLYRLATDAKYHLYARGILRRKRLPVFTASVGNLAIGGTGKTPFTIALARALARAGARPLVINKDYGGADPGTPKLVSDGDDLFVVPPALSDEACLTALALLSPAGAARFAKVHPGTYLPTPAADGPAPGIPVVACRNRARAFEFARGALTFDLVLLDDGFQHHELERDFDIVLLDAALPWGFEAAFPLGRLREPLSRLSRATAVVLANAERVPPDEIAMLSAEVRERFGVAEVTTSSAGESLLRSLDGRRRLRPDRLKGLRVLAFCGLGNPENFRATLAAHAPAELTLLDWPDHERYAFVTLHRLDAEIRARGCDLIVTTAKDAVKLPAEFTERHAERLLVLDRDVTVDPQLVRQLLAAAAAKGRPNRWVEP